MKIAIYEPELRVCGPATWAFHLRTGFRALGHECDVVTSTKSGRERVAWGEGQNRLGTRWWHHAPDHCVKHVDLPGLLDGYDRAILTDLRTTAQDKDAKKTDGTLPVYVETMMKTSTPWTTAYHGNVYPPSETPFTEEMFSSSSFVDVIVDQTETSIRKNPMLAKIDTVFTELPYAARYHYAAPVPAFRHNSVGATGRFIYNKGHHIVGLMTPYLWEDCDVQLWGSCSLGLGPSPTFLVFEALKNAYGNGMSGQGQDYERFGPVPESPEGGNIVQPFNWHARMAGGRTARYLGNYEDQVATCEQFGVHVNLTTRAFSSLNVEFATLEAMDAGCIPIACENVSGPNYRMRRVPGVETWSSPEKLKKDDTPVRRVAQIVKETRDYALYDMKWRETLVRENREAIALLHDPRRVAGVFLNALK